MSDRATELNNASLEYARKADTFKDELKNALRNSNPNISSVKRDIISHQLDLANKTSVPKLYETFKKNADSMKEFGEQSYPGLSYNASIDSFTNAPKFDHTIKELVGNLNNEKDSNKSLRALMSPGPTVEYEGIELHPCLMSHDGGATEHSILDATTIPVKETPGHNLTKIGLSGCLGQRCTDCLDCRFHRKLLKDSIDGLMSKEPMSDAQRLLHAKNAISTLNSWASHEDTRGGDKQSCNDPQYRKCLYNHQVMSTNLRSMASSLTSALQQDYQESRGKGGGIHRDNFIGDNEDAY